MSLTPCLDTVDVGLGIVYPEITEMQARAIFEAAVDVSKRGITVLPEIMIPLVGHINELSLQREVVVNTAETVFSESRHPHRISYRHDDRIASRSTHC